MNSALCGFRPECPLSEDGASGDAAAGCSEKPSDASGTAGRWVTSPWERSGEGVLAKPDGAKELARRRGSCTSSKLL